MIKYYNIYIAQHIMDIVENSQIVSFFQQQILYTYNIFMSVISTL